MRVKLKTLWQELICEKAALHKPHKPRQMLSEMQHCLERDAESVTVAGRLAKVKAGGRSVLAAGRQADLVATGSPRALQGAQNPGAALG